MENSLDKKSSLAQFINRKQSVLMIFGLLLCMLIIGRTASDRFITVINIGNILEQTAGLAIVAIGQALVILTGGIDLSVGAMVSVGCAMMSELMRDSIISIIFAMLLICVIGMTAGTITGLGITKLKIPPFAMTLAMMMILNGVALKLRPKPGGYIPIEFSRFFTYRIGGILPVAFLIVIAAYMIMVIIMSSTRFGRNAYAVGGNEKTAKLSGIRVERTKILIYALSGLFAAIGSMVLTARMGTGDYAIGKYFSMDAVTASVLGSINMLGGRGELAGVVAAAIILTILNNILNLTAIDAFYQYALKGIILIAIVFIFTIKDNKR